MSNNQDWEEFERLNMKLPTPPNQDTEVDEILNQLFNDKLMVMWNGKTGKVDLTEAKSALNAHYKSIMEEIIGEDESLPIAIDGRPIDKKNPFLQFCQGRNAIRQQLRQRLESRLGK